MHEAVIAGAIIRTLKKECKKAGIKHLKRAHIEIGEMRNVVSPYLQTAYKLGIKNTGLKGSRLYIKILPVKMTCGSCGVPVKTGAKCKKCGGFEVKISSGLELKIASISGE